MNTGLIKNQRIWGTVIKIPLTMLVKKEKRSVRKEDARLVGLKGEQNKAIFIAQNMLTKGYDLKTVSELTGLSIEELLALK